MMPVGASQVKPNDPRRAPDTSLTNSASVELENNTQTLNQKIDTRNHVDYTFAGTTEVAIDHKLGRTPRGYIVTNKSKAAHITGDKNKWTDRKVYLTSSVANNQVSFIFY